MKFCFPAWPGKAWRVTAWRFWLAVPHRTKPDWATSTFGSAVRYCARCGRDLAS